MRIERNCAELSSIQIKNSRKTQSKFQVQNITTFFLFVLGWNTVQTSLGEIHPSTPTGFSKTQKLIKNAEPLDTTPEIAAFFPLTVGSWWISWQFLWWGQMCNCRTLAPVLTARAIISQLVSQGVTLMEAGRGSWTNAGDCSLNTSSCECTMSSLRPTEPGRNPKHKVHFPMRLPCAANTSALYFPETSHYVTTLYILHLP